jgi:hypothetical protein
VKQTKIFNQKNPVVLVSANNLVNGFKARKDCRRACWMNAATSKV